jgi:hypothetical protein
LITYVKILGPPHLEVIRSLEKIAIEMPEICIMDSFISNEIPKYLLSGYNLQNRKNVQIQSYDRIRNVSHIGPDQDNFAFNYFSSNNIEIPIERCNDIISKSGRSLGDYDFYFEWMENPNGYRLNEFIEKIDNALINSGCYYTLYNKKGKISKS